MELVKLKELVNPVSSSLKMSQIKRNGKYSVYGASGICGYLDSYIIDKDYVAIVKDGSGVGHVHRLYPKQSFLGTMQGLVPKKDVYADYIFYLMQYLDLGSTCVGAAIPHIYFKNYGDIFVQKNDYSDQIMISNNLSNICEMLEAKKSELKNLDELVKSRFICQE